MVPSYLCPRSYNDDCDSLNGEGVEMSKYRDLDQAMDDLVQAKRRVQSDGANTERTLERAAKYRIDAARLIAQAEEMEENARNWKARYIFLDKQVNVLRAERIAMQEQERFDKANDTLTLLMALDPEMIAKLLVERPELAPIVEAMKGGA